MSDLRHLPADDVILRGYCGPCDRYQLDWEEGVVVAVFEAQADVCLFGYGLLLRTPFTLIRFDLTLSPVRDHIARVMAEGVGCPRCHGDGTIPDPMQIHPPMCQDCSGFGYLLPSAPIEHLMDRHGSRLTAAQSAACVAWSYRSWRVGGPVLRGVIRPRSVFYQGNGWLGAHGYTVKGAPDSRVTKRTWGWRIGPGNIPLASGPETGSEGRACADRAALAHNFALINDDGSVTTPELPTDRSPK